MHFLKAGIFWHVRLTPTGDPFSFMFTQGAPLQAPTGTPFLSSLPSLLSHAHFSVVVVVVVVVVVTFGPQRQTGLPFSVSGSHSPPPFFLKNKSHPPSTHTPPFNSQRGGIVVVVVVVVVVIGCVVVVGEVVLGGLVEGDADPLGIALPLGFGDGAANATKEVSDAITKHVFNIKVGFIEFKPQSDLRLKFPSSNKYTHLRKMDPEVRNILPQDKTLS